MTTYVLIGAGLAGAYAAKAIRERDPDGHIILVGNESELPYTRPDLSKGYLLGRRPLEKVYWKPESFYTDLGVDLMLGTAAEHLDPARRVVTLAGGPELQYDRLLLATGGHARSLYETPGSNLPGIFTLRNIADASAIRDAAAAAHHAVVLGGGFIGAEAAAGLTMLGLETTLVLREGLLLGRALGDVAARFISDYFRAKGVTLISGASVESFSGEPGRLDAVRLTSGRTLPADIVVQGVGIDLDVRLAEQAGVELDRNLGGGIVTDEHLRTSRPEIYAAGDVAAFQSVQYQRRMRIEHWDNARKSGAVAGANMTGANETHVALPYFYSDLFDLDLQAYGDLYLWDETLVRLPLEPNAKPALAVFYLHRHVLHGALAINGAQEFVSALQALVQMKPMLTAGDRERLADPSAELL